MFVLVVLIVPKPASINVVSGSPKLGMIREVKGFKAKLQALPFTNLEVLDGGKIPVNDARGR